MNFTCFLIFFILFKLPLELLSKIFTLYFFFINSSHIFEPIKPVPPVIKKVFFLIISKKVYIFFLTSFASFFNQVVLKP